MKLYTLLLLFLVSALPFVPVAHSNETSHWKTVGNWRVMVNPTLDYGCFVFTTYGKAFLRVGVDRSNDQIYLTIYDQSWQSLGSGKKYDLTMEFDNEGPWNVSATAADIGDGVVALTATTTTGQFLVEFMKRHYLNVRYQGDIILRLPLDGSYKAVMEMAECQKTAGTASQGQQRSRDPFAGNPDDPFQ